MRRFGAYLSVANKKPPKNGGLEKLMISYR